LAKVYLHYVITYSIYLHNLCQPPPHPPQDVHDFEQRVLGIQSKQSLERQTSLAMLALLSDASVVALREVTIKVTSLSALFFKFILVILDVRAANICFGSGVHVANIC
jgi:hypothetical protein